MADIQLSFHIDDVTLAFLERVRGENMSLEQILHRAMQYGLANILEEFARVCRDYAVNDTSNKTGVFLESRDLLDVKPAKKPDKLAVEKNTHATTAAPYEQPSHEPHAAFERRVAS